MSTSGTYSFGQPQSRLLIDDAYRRIGVLPSLIDPDKIESAQLSLNFILQEWAIKGHSLWTIRSGMLGLNPNQNSYQLPTNLIDLKTVALRKSQRNLGGAASASTGNAILAFDGNPATACVQTAPDGYIAYDWAVHNSVYATAMVGVQSNATLDYTLVFQSSTDGFVLNTTTVATIPKQTYPVGQIQWFTVPVPIFGSSFRIMETGGATLNIQELYFNTAISDLIITRISETDYTSLSQKNLTAQPSSFYLDRQISPILYLWPTPNGIYNALYYTYWKSIQDVGDMLDNAEIPARFLKALCLALTLDLGVKAQLPTDKLSILGGMAEEAYKIANLDDRERVSVKIYPRMNYS